MNGRGGRRPGAGRPPGSRNQRTVEIARAAVEAGITPIEVMLSAMRELWDQDTPESKREAAAIAKDAARSFALSALELRAVTTSFQHLPL